MAQQQQQIELVWFKKDLRVEDHATAYRQAHDRMHRLRSQQSAQAEARSIQQKHGSRKSASKRWR